MLSAYNEGGGRSQGQVGPCAPRSQPSVWVLASSAFTLSLCNPLLSAVQYIYYRRTRRLDVPLINSIRLLPDGQAPPPAETWTKVSRSVRDGVSGEPPLFLWYRTGKTGHDLTAQERQDDLITELDVLYGAGQPWYGFENKEPTITVEGQGLIESEWLTFRKGVKSELVFL